MGRTEPVEASSRGASLETELGGLAAVGCPARLGAASDRDLERLAAEMRDFLIRSVTRTGGHLGAALGVVELTIALFAELDFGERDRIVWDVGHQTYPHKILTGRAARFDSLRRAGGLSGYPDPAESPYDTVKTGHGGTSVSTALGFALAWRAGADRARRAVAVLGDGALQEGNAYEALNHAGGLGPLPLIVVLNDNGMAIGTSVGAVHGALRSARTAYRTGATAAFFAELGFRYLGPFDGHDIASLRRALGEARRLEGPVLLHVVTRKGNGYRDEARDPTCHHAVSAPASGVVELEYPQQGGRTFAAAFGAHAIEMAERDPRVVAISAAMIDGTGLGEFQSRFPDRCFDVGMAEQHAVALAASLALAGKRPICAIYSTFLQRAYDQLFQEVALQRARVLFCIDRAGLVGSDGATHNGVFDIGFLRCLPNFALLSPRDPGELPAMMELARQWNGPVAIRYPRGSGARPELRMPPSPLGLGRAERLAPGADGAIVAYGPQVYAALALRRRVRALGGRTLAVIDARFAKPLDVPLLEAEWRRQPVLFTLEDHSTACGFGSAVAELGLTRLRGRVDLRKLCPLGLPDRFIDHGERGEQLADAGLGLGALEARVLARLERVVELRRWKARRAGIVEGDSRGDRR